MKASSLAWGFKLATSQDGSVIEAPALWGARLIFNEPSSDQYSRPIELLWDRQDIQADTEEAKAALLAKLNGTPNGTGAIQALIDFLSHEARKYRIDRTSTARFDRTLKGVRFRGSPNGSHGYVYVTASLEDIETCDGCGTGGIHKGTKKFPGICDKCRDERKADERERAKLQRERTRRSRLSPWR